MIVFCDDETCAYCKYGKCTLPAIQIEVREGEFKDGKREVFNSCQNYRGNVNGES